MPASDAPLAGVSVIELAAIGPVPFAGMRLRELGADVVRVLPPTDRAIGLELDAEADLLNRGKPVRRLDLKGDAGAEALHALLAGADVLLEGFRPGTLERLGFEPDALLARHPRLVVGRLSGFGDAGPLAGRAGHDINYLALSGALGAIGPASRPAVPLNLVADFGGGAMHLLMGVLARLVRRGIDGRGGVATTSILAGTLGLTPMFHGLLAAGRWSLSREANVLDGGCPYYTVYATRDERFVAVGALETPFFAALVELIGLAGAIDVERRQDPATWPTMRRAFAGALRTRTRDEWSELARDVDCCLSPVLDLAEALDDPQCRANGLVEPAPFPRPTGIVRFAVSPELP